MAQPPRTATAGTFFVTAITLNRRRRFQVDATARLFIETLQHYRAASSYKLFAFVVMPDHIHLLLKTDDISKSMKDIKGGFHHRLGLKPRFWQPGFTDHLILNREQFESRRGYIHHNPVREHLVLWQGRRPCPSVRSHPKILVKPPHPMKTRQPQQTKRQTSQK
jgi:putative transposase